MRKGVSVCYSWDMSEIEDRRQRALEAGEDAADIHDPAKAVEVAVEVATQVKITTEIIAAASTTGRGYGFDMTEALKAAFRAAGFEVIE